MDTRFLGIVMTYEFFSEQLSRMDPVILYQVLKLRTDVFVVEQNCPYPELDGRDLEADAVQLWASRGDEVVATIRILHEKNGLRIGRVVAAPEVRGTGVARRLFGFTLGQCQQTAPGARILLDAQAPLQGWYESFGFIPSGKEFLEDGIPHIPMARPAESAMEITVPDGEQQLR